MDKVEAYNGKYRVDDLQVNGLKVLQDPDGYCFTSDAVILANFAKVKRFERGVELGSGSGIISILLTGKYGAGHMTGVEIQPCLADMSKESVALNGLGDKIDIVCTPMQEAHNLIGRGGADVIVTNPPYTRAGDGNRNLSGHLAMCRHEVSVNLSELAASAARLVKYGGRLYMVHQSERLAEIFAVLRDNNFEPKVIRFVEGREGLKPTIVLIEAHSHGNAGLTVMRNLTLYTREGKETEELRQIYSRC